MVPMATTDSLVYSGTNFPLAREAGKETDVAWMVQRHYKLCNQSKTRFHWDGLTMRFHPNTRWTYRSACS